MFRKILRQGNCVDIVAHQTACIMGYHTMSAPCRFFFLGQSPHPEGHHRQAFTGQQMHDAGMRMFMPLIGIAEIGMGIDMDKTNRRVKRIDNAHHRTIAKTVFAAQCHRYSALRSNGARDPAQIIHHRLNRAAAINWWCGKHALGTGQLAVNQSLKLVAGGNHGRRPLGRACAVRHGFFQPAWHNMKQRRRRIIFRLR